VDRGADVRAQNIQGATPRQVAENDIFAGYVVGALSCGVCFLIDMCTKDVAFWSQDLVAKYLKEVGG
jgi:hypothetical protein